jgi:hypothetical protein
MKTLIAFIKRLFTSSASLEAQANDQMIFTTIKNHILPIVGGTFGDGIFHESINGAENLGDLMVAFKKYFVAFCQWEIITSSMIEEYKAIFSSHHIYANTMASKGFLLVDNNNFGTAYNDTTAVAIHYGKIYGCDRSRSYGFNHSTLEIQNDLAYGEADDHCSMSLFARSSGKAFLHSEVFAWDNSHVEAHNHVSVSAYGNSTYEIYDEATVIKALRDDASENTPTDEEVEVWYEEIER